MKKFQLCTTTKNVNFNFPTSLSEIPVEYLLKVTENIKIADNYTLVGIVYHERLGSIILTRKQRKQGLTSGIVPIFIKAGTTDNKFINSAKCKNKLVIPTSQLNLGYHVIAPSNVLSIDYFIRCLDKDNSVAQRYNNNYGNEECFFVEFKLVPNCDIVGFYEDKKIELDCPFVEVELLDEGGN